MKQVILLLSISILVGCFGKVSPVKTGLEKQSLPDFKLLLADSTTYFSTKNIPKESSFVIFCFGPHCPYSRAEMEEITRQISLLRDYRIYAITPWPFSEMKAFYNYYNLKNYKNITTGYDIYNVFENHYSIPGVPYVAVFGKEQRLKKAFAGKVSVEQIKDVLTD